MAAVTQRPVGSDPGADRPGRPPGGVRLGRVFGVPVFLSYSTLLFVALIAMTYSSYVASRVPTLSGGQAYAAAVVFAVLLFVSVFLHELGHAVVSLGVGIRVRSITLYMLGGITAMEREAPDPGRAYLVSVAGPMVSLFLAGAGALITPLFPDQTVTRELVAQVTVTNLLVAGFNLLPGLPLDGGQLLRAGVWRLTGNADLGTRAAAWVGRGVAVALVAVALVATRAGSAGLTSLMFALLVALFIWQSAGQALQVARVRGRLPRLHAGAMARPVVAVAQDLPLAEALRRLRAAAARGIVVVAADGTPQAIVVEEAVAATPEQRRPWVSVSAVARGLTAGLTLPADLAGEPLLQALQTCPATEYLVVDKGGRPVGVLATADVAAALNFAGAVR